MFISSGINENDNQLGFFWVPLIAAAVTVGSTLWSTQQAKKRQKTQIAAQEKAVKEQIAAEEAAMERAKKAQQIVLLTKATERLKSERAVKTTGIGGIGKISPMILITAAVGGIALISFTKGKK